MAFDVVAASFRTKEKVRSPLERTILTGLLFGIGAVYLAAVGILLMFHGRWIIDPYLTLGQATLLLIGLAAGLQIARTTTARSLPAIAVQGLGVGAIAGVILGALVVLISQVKLRFMFVAFSKPLLDMLTFDLDTAAGVTVLVVGSAALGAAGALFYLTPAIVRRPIGWGLTIAAFVGLFQELIQLMMQYEGIIEDTRAFLFTWDGLKLQSAILIFVVVGGGMFVWMKKREQAKARFAELSPAAQRTTKYTSMAVVAILLLLFPLAAGNFIGQVMMTVGLFVLMGMGLNLEVGLAGLLDLGFVAFFAVGAYTTGLLTADSPYALASLSYWEALPIAVLASLFVGVLFGVPVLRVRGDYLAVATLGLGEIIRVIVLSDAAAPLLAGAQGILNIPRPQIGAWSLDNPVDLFYLTLVLSAVAAYTAWRLENSRLGRAWTAIRDDEDVAQALGINLINVKLLAYGLGAVFAGVAGSIFAVMLTSIFPHSFQLIISINVLALIIVGGMGSLPGVAVGALALIGLPELLREFGEYRFLFYGVVIVVMTRLKPQGLWPSAARRREFQLDEEDEAPGPQGAQAAAGPR
jgi:branched-chain amino acid transport system permease protein